MTNLPPRHCEGRRPAAIHAAVHHPHHGHPFFLFTKEHHNMHSKPLATVLMAAVALAFSASAAAETYSFTDADIVLEAWVSPYDATEEPLGFRVTGQDGFSLTAFGAHPYEWQDTTVVLGFTAAAPGSTYSIDWANSWLDVSGTQVSLADFAPTAADGGLAAHAWGGNGLTSGAAWVFTAPNVDIFYISGGSIAYSVTSVPEPETWAMLLAGFGLIGSIARRRVRG
jgi:hypothetical protein